MEKNNWEKRDVYMWDVENSNVWEGEIINNADIITESVSWNNEKISQITENKEKLSEKWLQKIIENVISKVVKNWSDYYWWKNSPEISENWDFTQEQWWWDNAETVEISTQDAKNIYDEKLNWAYWERFVMSLWMVSSLMKNWYNIRFVQFQDEKWVPFDASWWTVMVIEWMPMFHISPDDLDAEWLWEYVEVLDDNNASDVCRKETNKVWEFEALLMWSMQSGLNLEEIARNWSK